MLKEASRLIITLNFLSMGFRFLAPERVDLVAVVASVMVKLVVRIDMCHLAVILPLLVRLPIFFVIKI